VKTMNCHAKVKVIYPSTEFGSDLDQVIELPCCLLSPHKGYKHENPRLQLTVGGDRITKDIDGNDITKTWSYCLERKEVL